MPQGPVSFQSDLFATGRQGRQIGNLNILEALRRSQVAQQHRQQIAQRERERKSQEEQAEKARDDANTRFWTSLGIQTGASVAGGAALAAAATPAATATNAAAQGANVAGKVGDVAGKAAQVGDVASKTAQVADVATDVATAAPASLPDATQASIPSTAQVATNDAPVTNPGLFDGEFTGLGTEFQDDGVAIFTEATLPTSLESNPTIARAFSEPPQGGASRLSSAVPRASAPQRTAGENAGIGALLGLAQGLSGQNFVNPFVNELIQRPARERAFDLQERRIDSSNQRADASNRLSRLRLAEQSRSNKVREGISRDRLDETERHHGVIERQSDRRGDISEANGIIRLLNKSVAPQKGPFSDADKQSALNVMLPVNDEDYNETNAQFLFNLSQRNKRFDDLELSEIQQEMERRFGFKPNKEKQDLIDRIFGGG